MNVLITGVPGWLGNRFLEILLHGFEGNQGPVLPWDRIRCVAEPGSETRGIENLSPKVEIARADITSNSLKGLCEGTDVLFHIAGMIHPPPSMSAVSTTSTRRGRGIFSSPRRMPA